MKVRTYILWLDPERIVTGNPGSFKILNYHEVLWEVHELSRKHLLFKNKLSQNLNYFCLTIRLFFLHATLPFHPSNFSFDLNVDRIFSDITSLYTIFLMGDGIWWDCVVFFLFGARVNALYCLRIKYRNVLCTTKKASSVCRRTRPRARHSLVRLPSIVSRNQAATLHSFVWKILLELHPSAFLLMHQKLTLSPRLIQH